MKCPVCLIAPLRCRTCLHRSPAGCATSRWATSVIWASMDVQIRQLHYSSFLHLDEQAYRCLSRRVTEWFARSGGLPLTLFIYDLGYGVHRDPRESHPSDILLETILSYSRRWKNFHFKTDQDLSIPILRIFGLTADDVPILQSITPST